MVVNVFYLVPYPYPYREYGIAAQNALAEQAYDSAGVAYNMMALALESLGPDHLADAEAAYVESLRLAPNQAAHHSNFGNFLTRLGKHQVSSNDIVTGV